MIAIETARLTIRNFTRDDWQDLLEIAVGYQASEMAQYDHKWPTSEDEIRGVAAWFATDDRFLAVCLKSTGKVIGFVSLPPEEGADSLAFGFGYVFHFDYHGQGYATESCRAAIDYAFGELGADRIHTGTAAANEPSCRLLARLGMQETGRSTGHLQETPDGQPIEFPVVSFALTREQWLARAT
jgi:RimJ/RimL family protein N-acetyltransferase